MNDARDAGAAVDMAAGAERVLGDHQLFARILERFRRDYLRAGAAIRAALAAGDTVLAQRLAHTLKGASGMIEARALERAALVLEQALRAGDGGYGPLLERLDAELARVLRELDALPAQTPQTQQPAAVGHAPLDPREALRELAVLLDRGDGAALDLLGREHDALAAVLGEARLAEVAAAAEDFDFERALALLKGAGA